LLHNEDPAQRPSLDQILNHGFMTQVDPTDKDFENEFKERQEKLD